MNKFAIGCGVVVVILLFIAVVVALALGGTYNRLVRLQQSVDQSWAQVQNVYQRRADLIPKLVNTVSGAANFEKSTLVEVRNARASVGQVKLDPNKAPTDPAELAQFQAAQGQLSNALSRLLVVVERYPELKANQNFVGLQAQLEGTENRISVERGTCSVLRSAHFSPRNRAQKDRRLCLSILGLRHLHPQQHRNSLHAWIEKVDRAVHCSMLKYGGEAALISIARRSGRSTRLLAVALLALLVQSVRAAEIIPPKPTGYFNDYANVVSKEAAHRFNEQLAQFERETSDQVVVAVFPKMQSDSSIEDYTQRVAQAWGVGQKDRRNGVALFVFVADRKMFIQVGYGLEGALPDIMAFDITEYRIKPHFRNGDYEGGLATGIDLICKAVRGEYKGSGKTVAEQRRNTGAPGLLFFIIFVIVLIVISRVVRRLAGYGYSSGRGGPIFLPVGGGGGGWSSGGGGGFSGFSGGGGSFGGGGAGSSW